MKSRMRRLAKGLGYTVLVLGVLFGLMQLIPYGRTHGNPRIALEPAWDTPRTRELAKRACFDCHSNETHWPKYASIAPMSWIVQYDVQNARDVVNFSEWNKSYPLAAYSSQSIQGGSMPPSKYKMAHPEANLTDAEWKELATGLDRTLKDNPSAAVPVAY